MWYFSYNLDSFITKDIQLSIFSEEEKEKEIFLTYRIEGEGGEVQLPETIVIKNGNNPFICQGKYGSYTIIASDRDNNVSTMTLNIMPENGDVNIEE